MFVRRKFRMIVACRVCQSTARYSYYGAIVCDSCKIFFRRHAQLRSPKKVCRWDNRCPITLQTRRRCSACRFAKCLANGMQRNMIRCSRTRILSASISVLTEDQVSLLAHLNGSFNECIALPLLDPFLRAQNALPVKLRFKHASIRGFFLKMTGQIEIFRKKLYSFHSCPSSTFAYQSNLVTMCVLHHAHLLDCALFPQPNRVKLIKDAMDQMGSDLTFIRLILAVIILFSDDSNSSMIRDRYISLAWTHLVDNSSDEHATRCFSRLIRCLLIVV